MALATGKFFATRPSPVHEARPDPLVGSCKTFSTSILIPVRASKPQPQNDVDVNRLAGWCPGSDPDAAARQWWR